MSLPSKLSCPIYRTMIPPTIVKFLDIPVKYEQRNFPFAISLMVHATRAFDFPSSPVQVLRTRLSIGAILTRLKVSARTSRVAAQRIVGSKWTVVYIE